MNNNEGYTIFKSLGVTIDYLCIDLENNKVTATISYLKKIKVTVIVDFNNNTVQIDGDFKEILSADPDSDANSYIEQIRECGRMFIEKEIINPKEYYESFLK